MQKPVNSEDQVWVTIKYTVQTHPYESATIEMGTSQTVTAETAEKARQSLYDQLVEEVVGRGENLRSEIQHRRKRSN